MNEFKNKWINYACFIIVCNVYNMLYTIFYLDFPHSQNADLVHIVQRFLRVVNWITFILRESGIQDQSQTIFTCCLNIWIIPLKCTKGRQMGVEGRSWGSSTRIYLGGKKRGKGRQRKPMGSEYWKIWPQKMEENRTTYQIPLGFQLFLSLRVLVELSLDLERHLKFCS